ncbi:hypothetical protein HJFPF1_08387 [Paramyrothecium foliicola]|nr:hypothetical protein HJFPF1_08387 [Paramyrothecium foliicola]
MPSRLYARDVIAFTDLELDQYLTENGRQVNVRDPNNLTESFIERLRRLVTDSSHSFPVDLEQVSARLSGFVDVERSPPSEGSRTPGSTPLRSGTVSPLSEEGVYLQDLDYEKRFYNQLVKHGARPWYPIELLESVSRRPEDHVAILRYWQGAVGANPKEWRVFGLQYQRWKKFNKWRAMKRKKYDGCISTYTGWALELLERHSYTLSTDVNFKHDPSQQEQLTTLVEYLTYEYAAYDEYQKSERSVLYKKHWGELVKTGVLRSHETEEFIWSPESAAERVTEQRIAEKALKSAQLDVKCKRKSASESPRRRRAYRKLTKAQAEFDSIKTRNDNIQAFKRATQNYKDAKSNVERHTLLLQWIQDQIHQIEIERETAKRAEGSPDATLSCKKDAKDTSSSSSTITGIEGKTLKRRWDNSSTDEGTTSKQLSHGKIQSEPRRSKRIAACNSISKISAE